MGRWLYYLLFLDAWSPGIPPNWWHAHEMVFGFALPVIAGFLLTAVATWTNLPGTRGWRLQLLFGLWLVARLVLWLAPQWSMLAWLAEMLFILFVASELGQRVWARRQWHNMLFLPVLLILMLLSSASYLSLEHPVMATRLHYGAVWMITVFIVIIGGRVIPLFTANRLGLKIAPLPPWLEYLSIGSIILVGLLMAVLPQEALHRLAEGPVPGNRRPASLSAGALAGVESGWRAATVVNAHQLCLHTPRAAGYGAGGDRPDRGQECYPPAGDRGHRRHDHRHDVPGVPGAYRSPPRYASQYLAFAFILVFLAAVIRAAVPAVDASMALLSWRLSAVLWIVAFVLFLYRYLPMLTRPRADGKPG